MSQTTTTETATSAKTAAVTLTDKAVKEIKRIMEEQKLPAETALRLAVKGGGCSGFSYAMGFDNKPTEFDDASEISGIKILVDKNSLLYLAGMEVDFNDDIMGRGFVFNNPNATSGCGCGSSFSV